MKNCFVVGITISLFLAMALISDYAAAATAPKYAVISTVKLKAGAKAKDLEGELGGDALKGMEDEYKGAKGLIALYRLKGSKAGASSKMRGKPGDYGHLQLWDTASNAQKFLDPEGSGKGRDKLKNARDKVQKWGKTEFSGYDLELIEVP